MASDRNVLIIDDSETVRKGIRLVLRSENLFDGYYECPDAESALRLIGDIPFEMILCDLILPGVDGFEFLRLAQNHPRLRDVPIIMLTGQKTVSEKIKGLGLGAADYLTKPFDPGELIARVKVQQKVKRLQDELRTAKQKYKELAITDFLTGITNRRHFMELFRREFSRAHRTGAPLGLILFDIDHFKQINDHYGHQQGDRVLMQLGAVVSREIRGYDLFARFGGEEFVVALPDTNFEAAAHVAEKLRAKVDDIAFEGMDRRVTISLGVAGYPRHPAKSDEHLIGLADAAMYLAKQRGRNRVETADELDVSAFDDPGGVTIELPVRRR